MLSTIEITRPELLALVLCVLPVLWYFRRSLVDFVKGQKRASLITRCLVMLLVVLAAAGLNWVRTGDRQYIVFLLDRSDSTDAAAAAQAEAFVQAAAKELRGRDVARVIDFAGHASPPRDPGTAFEKTEDIEPGHTDIGDALSVAWASIPADYAKTLVLLSDGRATRGDAAAVGQSAGHSGVRICTVPLESTQQQEVQLSAVHGPAQVRSGAPFELEVEIASSHEDKVRLEIFRDEIRVGTEEVDVAPGENRFRLRQIASTDQNFSLYTVQLTATKDKFLDNNSATAVVACEGKPSVLIIGPADKVGTIKSQEPYLVRALRGEDIRVFERPPRGAPRTLEDIDDYDLLILSNVPANDLDQHQMQLIRTYVQDLGGGLIMLGGDQSFGLGGYYKSILEEILPVRSDFEKEKEKPSLAMVLVIDKSGSMGGQKIELAKEAARATAELLGPKDQLGVIAFDGAPKWVCEVHPASDRGYVIDRISTLVAGGGTNLAPAMSQAFMALEETTAKLKHVIILTDGHSQPGNFYEVTSSMAAASITVSTVAVGTGADRNLLERIANWGNGRTYFTESPASIPQIFARETVEASKSAINEQPFLPIQVRPHQICEGLDLEKSPFLLGYVITKPKPTAELVLATEAGHPLLATWRYGLGRSLAFTSDAKNRWAAEWLQWTDFAKFWSQVVRDTMRSTSPSTMHVTLERHGNRMHAAVDALHPSARRAGEYLDDVTTTLQLIQPGVGEVPVELTQAWPGRYTGAFDVLDGGSYRLRVVQSRDGQEVQSTRCGVTVGYSDEYRIGPPDEDLLRQLAESSGGTFDPEPAAIIDPTARSVQVTPLWPYLLMAALCLFVLDVALRRVDVALLLGKARPWSTPASAG